MMVESGAEKSPGRVMSSRSARAVRAAVRRGPAFGERRRADVGDGGDTGEEQEHDDEDGGVGLATIEQGADEDEAAEDESEAGGGGHQRSPWRGVR
jgi:hypothetical protein